MGGRSAVDVGGGHGSGGEGFDVDDPRNTRFDLVREGIRRDGMEIVHYAPAFPLGKKSRVEKRVERTVALLFVLAGLLAIGFVVAYIWWPFRYQYGPVASKLYTPILGATLGGSMVVMGLGVIVWAKKLLPSEEVVQDRHDGPSPYDEQKLTGATIMNVVDETGVKRRPLIKAALLLPAAGLGAAAVAPLVGGLLKNPSDGHPLLTTGWNPANNDGKAVALTRDDGTPIRPEDVNPRGQMTVFPGIPGGSTTKWADSPVLLIHLAPEDAAALRASIAESEQRLAAGQSVAKPVVNGMWQDFVAYSKICTHAGCPASLFEQQTNRLLCPCHQSQFLIIDQAKPIFGPANRKLPMLPLDVQNGFFVARSDFLEPIGPTYWERPVEIDQQEATS
ncbi:MAG TPA: Rieske 2Fe-2S domain-containing protein [Micromonosporaceae bacterium]